MAPSVLLIGASGAVGRPLVRELIRQKARFGRIAILASNEAKRAKFDEAAKAGIELLVGSFLKTSSYNGFDIVMSLLGDALHKYQPAMIDLAYEAGVRQFYPSEFGADLSQQYTYLHRSHRSKLDTRAHLKATAESHPDFKYTLVVNGLFAEWSDFGLDQSTKTFTHYGQSDAPLHLTSLPDISRCTVESVFIPFEGPKRELKIVGEKSTVQDVAHANGKIRGMALRIQTLDSSIPRQKQIESFEAEDEAGEFLWALREFLHDGHCVVNGETSNHLFDFRLENLEEALQRHHNAL